MKKTLTLLVLVLAMLFAVGVAAQADTPDELLGKWKAVGGDHEPTEGVEQYFVFTETEMTTLVVYYGEEYAETMPYTIEGNAVVAEDYPVNFEVDGDTLTMWDDEMTIIFTRVTDEAGEATAVPAELLGKWKAVGGDYESTEGVEQYFVFTETEMTTLAVYYGEEYAETMPYTIEGNAIVAEDVPVNFELAGDTLTMWDGEITIIFARVGGEAEADAPADTSVLVGEWKLLGAADEQTAQMMPEGYEAYFIFTETEMTAKVVYEGEEQTTSAFYTIEGNRLVQDVSEMTWEMDGDILILTEDGVSLRFERVASGIIGEWDIVEMLGDEEGTKSLEMIKALGGYMHVIFTDTEMTLTMSLLGQTEDETHAYTLEDGMLVIADGSTLSYVLEGDRLILGTEDDGMVLERIEAAAQEETAVQELPVTGEGVIGEWTLVEAQGENDAVATYQMVLLLGGSVELTIAEDSASLTISIMGETNTDITDCTIIGDVAYLDGGTVCTLQGHQLMVTEEGMEGITLVFERVGTAEAIALEQTVTDEEAAVKATGVAGEWNLISIEGDAEGTAYFAMVQQQGGSIELVITESRAVMTVCMMDVPAIMRDSVCTIVGDTAYMEDGAVCVLVGGQLIFTADGVTMVYERK